MSGAKRGVVERTRGYFANPSTHVGFYMAGIGSMAGGTGGIVKGVADLIYADGPTIFGDICRGSWQEALYHTAAAATNVLATSAYVASAGAVIGYVGGSLVTDRILGRVSSFFGRILSGYKKD